MVRWLDPHQLLGTGALWASPSAFVLIMAVIAVFGATIRLAHDARGIPRLLIGLGHTALQFGGLAVVIVVASALSTPLSGATSLLVFLALVWVIGGIGAVLGISGYLWATNRMGYHANEAYAPLHYAGHKNFLRIRIDATGSLTVYPLGVDRVGRRWRFDPGADSHAPWLKPAGEAPAVRLIEAPVKIQPT